jgi:hypothetical protein
MKRRPRLAEQALATSTENEENPMKTTQSRTSVLALACASALAACGGGGGGSDTPPFIPSAEGAYTGTLTGSTTYKAFELLVLENGDFWSLYGTQGSSSFSVAGFLQGSGTTGSSTFVSANSKDFGSAPAISVPTNATFDATAKTISGTLAAPTGTVGFSGGPLPASIYNYGTAASLATVTGTWATTSLTGERVNVTVAASGTFTASSASGCNFSGTVAPRASGKNVFNVALTFGASPCALAGQAATGIALAYPTGSGSTQLIVAVTDSTRTVGSALVGVK